MKGCHKPPAKKQNAIFFKRERLSRVGSSRDKGSQSCHTHTSRMVRHGPEPLGETKHAFKRERSRSPAGPGSPKRQKKANFATPPRSAAGSPVASSSAAASGRQTARRHASSARNHGSEPEEQVAAEGQVPCQDSPRAALQFVKLEVVDTLSCPTALVSVGANGPLKRFRPSIATPDAPPAGNGPARNLPTNSSRVSPYSPRRSPRQQALQSHQVVGKGGASAPRGNMPTQPPSTSPAAETHRVPDAPRSPRIQASRARQETVQTVSPSLDVLVLIALSLVGLATLAAGEWDKALVVFLMALIAKISGREGSK